ncbi:amidase domain-containing protein [Clostridium tagluense]|uniref:amidase domain-containing protein n=1 Tax=Clostridium tagluense TaxID=360422 RepID=UPI001CF4632B|nr:amidase domain-containing protein [Clostridium tagluense]MCB2312170.1 amidase domain-containing protein [Clostridium tagluense]MCB2316757.1 amidase domain-containing protein [Clostridium tagluense]MCB2321617.1 amidase domain-containing protein [Clostridium tagluense]MCB2326626.1 amidase domain-containing protein [Clostridium tagluense]MCB2331349.1 amidase domain-containing protein [Clostridium tagluense]
MEFFKTSRYSRINAVNYARTYALHPNPSFRYFPLIDNETSGDCANFISQCLLAGGAPMIYNGSHPWWYNKANTLSTKDDTWSVTWTVAHSLYWTLKVNEQSNANAIKGLEIYDTSLLELGDLIFFEGNNGNIFHSAIITSFRYGQPLVSHHSFEALDIYYKNSWPAKRVHFFKISL